MKKEIRIFFTAMMFLTRLPVPRFTDHAPEYLERSSKYFPLIGYIVGFISGTVLLITQKLVSDNLALLFSIAAGILATGAFHEDGFADVCDAFGGGWTKEKILGIMKDSRLGTYGVTGLVLMLATKFLLLRELLSLPLFANKATSLLNVNFHPLAFLVTAHALSRFAAVCVIQTSTYAYEDDRSKSKPLASKKLSAGEVLLAAILAFVPFIFLPVTFLLCVVPVAFFVSHLRRYFYKWISGYTGDCLGAVQQLTEVVCYLSFILAWKFI